VWVKRATNLDDHWKLRLYKNSYGNIYNLRAKNFDAKTEPILHHIVSCFEKFLIAFTMVNENFRLSFIFDNPSVPFEQGRNTFFGSRFIDWGANSVTISKLQNLRVSDILPSVGNPLSWEEFRDRTGIGIPLQKFTVLKRACTSLEHRAVKEIPYQKKCESIEQWCNSKRQLSRKIRLILEEDLIEEIPHNIRKFSKNTETIINLNQSRTLNGLWGNKFFDNGTKTFLFKLLNNTLGYNYIVANFVRNINKDCSFCILNGVRTETRETPLHLFFDCPSVEPTLKTFYNWLWNTLDIEHISRQEFFVTPNTGNLVDDKVLIIINCIVKKYIWDCKQKHCTPNFLDLKTVVTGHIQTYQRLDKKFAGNLMRASFYANIIQEP
jgi:hypothetical protein